MNNQYYEKWSADYQKIVQEKIKSQDDILPGVTGFDRCVKFGDFEIQNQLNSKTPYLDLSDSDQLAIYNGIKRCYEFFISYKSTQDEDVLI